MERTSFRKFIFITTRRLSSSEQLENLFNHTKNDSFTGRLDRSLWSLFARQDSYMMAKKSPPKPLSQLNYVGNFRRSFAFHLLASKPTQNIVCSPITALLPIGKLALAAQGWSQIELYEAIGVGDKTALTRSFKTLIFKLRMLPGVTLNIASGIFLPHNKVLDTNFKKSANDIFKSGVEQINFVNKTKAADEINQWMSRQTSGLINGLVKPESFTKDVALVIANGIFFQGKWEKSFHKVESREFYAPSGKKTVNMLSNVGFYRYAKSVTLKAEIVEIPYEGLRSSLLIILPNEKNGLPSLLETIKKSPDQLNVDLDNLDESRVSLSFPKFKMETTVDLKSIYNDIGIQDIFQVRSGLSGIVKREEIAVTNAVQRAVLEMSENGTKAASATGFGSTPSKYILRVVFVANRPFLFIVQAETEQLFAGIYNGP